MTAAAEQRQALDRKAWATLAARAALNGWQLWRTDAGDGPQRFIAARWGMTRVMADVAELEQFLDHVGAAR